VENAARELRREENKSSFYFLFKGLDNQMESLFKAFKIKSVLVFYILASLVKAKKKYKVSACFFENTYQF
jgi:hypothetical protein